MKKRVALALLLAAMFAHHAWAQESLFDAAGTGNLAEVQALLDNGADVNARDNDGDTPLVVALRNNQDTVAFVEMLIAHGADVNAKDNNGTTPLHLVGDNRDVAEVLLAHGANVNARDNGGETPLYTAVQIDRADIAELLIAHGADVNIRDNLDKTPLDWVGGDNGKNVAEVLLAHGADVNAKDKYFNMTPLDYAATSGQVDFARVLLAHGADINAKDISGDTPLDSAKQINDADKRQAMMTLLQDAAAKQVQAAQAEQAAEDNIKRILQSGTPPAIPEEARRHYVMGSAAMKEVSSPSDYDEAICQYQQAVQLAPWWAKAYQSLGAALYGRKRYADAIDAWKLYLVAAPQAADARAVQDRIYTIQEKVKLGASQ